MREETAEKYGNVPDIPGRHLRFIKEEKDEELRRTLIEEHRRTRSRVNSEAYRKTKELVESGQEALAAAVESRGGRIVHRFTLTNAISGLVPAGEIEGLTALSEIARVSEDKRLGAHLNVSIPSTFADLWWSHGVTGGIHHAAIIDSGVDATHPAFLGRRVISGTFHATALTDPCYGDHSDSPDDLDGHGTHIAGIIMSQGTAQCPDCLGVAKGTSGIFNLKAAWKDSCTGGASMYISDAMAAVDWAESQEESPDVYNLSYGGDASSDDSDFARFLDGLVSTNGKGITVSAGNNGPSNTEFSDPAVAYNAITVTDMDDRNTPFRSDDGIHNSSSRGPTASGRKKPDLAAPGTRIGSARHDWEVWYDFIDLSGTSMAAPHVGGAFTLLQDEMGSGIGPSLMQKALLINSADSWTDNGTPADPSDDGPVPETHWDRTYGWGYMNLERAYFQKSGTFFDAIDPSHRYRLYRAILSPGDKATVVWNRRTVYADGDPPATWYPLTDIDLELRREVDNTLLDSSVSPVDNVEQVATTSQETVVLKVALSGTIVGSAFEPFGLAAAGNATPADFAPGFQNAAPPVVCPNTAFDLYQTLMNYGSIYSHNHSIQIETPPGWALASSNPQRLGSLPPNGRGYVSWSVISPPSGTHLLSVGGTSDSYNETIVIPSSTFLIDVKSPSFEDIPCSHPFYGWIERIRESGITAGCSPGLYCPDAPVTRKQMAVYIITAMGETSSSASRNAYFGDVQDDEYRPFINRMFELGITTGCGMGIYCPEDPVTRGQMAVFISAARDWSPFWPPASTFADVPSSHPFSGFIERLWRDGITSGCSTSEYCPDSAILRGQMAAIIAKAWP